MPDHFTGKTTPKKDLRPSRMDARRLPRLEQQPCIANPLVAEVFLNNFRQYSSRTRECQRQAKNIDRTRIFLQLLSDRRLTRFPSACPKHLFQTGPRHADAPGQPRSANWPQTVRPFTNDAYMNTAGRFGCPASHLPGPADAGQCLSRKIPTRAQESPCANTA